MKKTQVIIHGELDSLQIDEQGDVVVTVGSYLDTQVLNAPKKPVYEPEAGDIQIVHRASESNNPLEKASRLFDQSVQHIDVDEVEDDQEPIEYEKLAETDVKISSAELKDDSTPAFAKVTTSDDETEGEEYSADEDEDDENNSEFSDLFEALDEAMGNAAS